MPEQPRPAAPAGSQLLRALRRPQVIFPLAVVAGMAVVAFGVQPGGAAPEQTADAGVALRAASPAATTPAHPSPSPSASPPASTSSPAANDVAGARAAASASPSTAATASPPADTSPTPDLARQSTQCGGIQEQAVALAVEQAISGVSVRAQRAAIYPVDYFRCILMATGGQEAVSLARAVSKAQSDGATNAVLIDLWITNGGRDFGQVNLKGAKLAAAGQTFAPLATLGGRADVVVASGQGRNVTLVVTLANGVGPTPGPMTLTIDAPLVGGKPT
ncbi:MAG: hypothetical protein IT304_08820, partial [Dehalococcoidia bacterium]|nr:hypothetical protein [Dehalococcoidia bacterium]